MSDEPIARKALREAGGDARPDASRLVAAVPAMMREARRRRNEVTAIPTLGQLSTWAIPRLAAVTAVGVIAATSYVSWERSRPAVAPPPTIESVILGADAGGTGDVVFDALLKAGRSDG